MKNADIIIKNATIVTVNKDREILKNHSLVIAGDRITDISPSDSQDSVSVKAKKEIDAAGKVVFPGLINTHTHLFQTLLKGLGDDLALDRWLSTMTFPSAIHLTPEHALVAARLGCLESIRSGTTTVLDYMYPHPREGLSDAVIQAFREVRVRGIFGRGMIDTGGRYGIPEKLLQVLPAIEKDVIRLLDSYNGSENGRVRVWVAPAAIWSCSERSLRRMWEIANEYNTGLTVHISETPFDRHAACELHGAPDAEILESFGIAGPNVLMVHCVYLTDRDIRMAKYYDLKVSHNPVSNMYLASGVPRIPRMIESGITVGVATDGAASNNSQDMIEVLKFTALLQKGYTMDPTILSADKVVEMATIDGARALGMEKEIGSIEVGKKADLFIYNPALSAKSTPMHNPVSTIVYSGTHACVETVVIDGNIILDNGVLATANEEEIILAGQKAAEDLAVRTGTIKNKYRRWRTLAF